MQKLIETDKPRPSKYGQNVSQINEKFIEISEYVIDERYYIKAFLGKDVLQAIFPVTL